MQIFAKKKKKRGFTLIELLVVIAIIGILAGIVLVSLGGARSKARDAVRQSDIRQLVTAQEMYYDENAEAYLQDDGSILGTPAVGNYLTALHDPQCPAGVCSTGAADYVWLENNNPATCNDSQVFCAYATMENLGGCTDARYFAASEQGTKEICETAPDDGCACW